MVMTAETELIRNPEKYATGLFPESKSIFPLHNLKFFKYAGNIIPQADFNPVILDTGQRSGQALPIYIMGDTDRVCSGNYHPVPGFDSWLGVKIRSEWLKSDILIPGFLPRIIKGNYGEAENIHGEVYHPVISGETGNLNPRNNPFLVVCGNGELPHRKYPEEFVPDRLIVFEPGLTAVTLEEIYFCQETRQVPFEWGGVVVVR
jgi:hypothetical protein